MKLYDDNNQSIDFDIPSQFKNIMINCSGGADSAILLYMVCKFLKDNERLDTKVQVLTCNNDKKWRWNGRKAADIINYIIYKLNWNQFDMHYVFYRDVQDDKYWQEIQPDFFKQKRCDLIVSGITANPKIPAFIERSDGNIRDLAEGALPERYTDNKPNWYFGNNETYYEPFCNIDKRFIAAMYKQYEVEDLINYTRSCEAIPDPKLTFYADFERKPCGKCWWCCERKWAFGNF